MRVQNPAIFIVMSSGRKRWLYCYLWPLLQIFLTYLLVGFYYNTNDDEPMSLILRGAAMDGSPEAIGSLLYFFAPFTSWLYQLLPAVPWFALLLYLIFLWAFAVIHRLLYDRFYRWLGLSGLILVSAFLFVFAFMPQLVFFNFTRVAMLGSGVALWAMYERKYFSGVVLFVLCFSIRSEAALLGGGLVLWYLILEHMLQQGRTGRWIQIALPFLLIVAVSLLTPMQFSVEERAEARRAAYCTNYSGFRIEKDYWMHFPGDSLRREALERYFFADKNVLDQQTLDRITYRTVLNEKRFSQLNPQRLHEVTSELWGNMQKSYTPILMAVLALGLFGLWKFNSGGKGFLLQQVIFWLSILLALSAMAFFLKMPDRILGPILTLSIVLTIMTALDSKLWDDLRLKVLVILAVLVGSISYFSFLSQEVKEYRKNRQLIEERWSELLVALEAHPAQDLWFAIPAYDLLVDTDPFKEKSLGPIGTERDAAAKLVFMDGWTCVSQYFGRHLEKRYGTKSFSDAIISVAERSSALLLSNEEHNDFLTRYFREFYEVEIVFAKVDQIGPLGLYRPSLKQEIDW